jgi:N-acetylglucosaminyldiphosphoundecaprenol N-acetyl-beta-D-mannosaminyltransferase
MKRLFKTIAMNIERLNILGLEISHLIFENAIEQVIYLGKNYIRSYVCFANSHMTVEAYKDKKFAEQVNAATMVLADGKPVALSCSFLYKKRQERIAGLDFVPQLLSFIDSNMAEPRVFFYGSTQKVLDALIGNIRKNYPRVVVAGAISPPFRVLEKWELNEYIALMNKTQPHFVFVSLGCPKQEKWMAANSKDVNAVLLGVGAAFETMAGSKKRAPKWMQNLSLEWLYRLMQEPRRLFKRYFVTNTLFIYLLVKTLFKRKFYGRA